ncbi:MAG TPA: AAA family ATPase, partial [Blastocatellia bacterium]|nr:AAA family ATPase [Blastocatellia bacterium]
MPFNKIAFHDLALNNWDNILDAAISRRKFDALLQACIEDSDSDELRKAYNEYVKNSQQPTSGGDVLNDGEDGTPPDQSPRTNLLVQPELIGRDEKIKEFTNFLRQKDVRLLTLTGPSGVGKTVLAKYLAVSLVDDFKDGVYLVELASVSDPKLVATEIGNVMSDFKQTVGVSLTDYLRNKQRLLVLDNFDTVISAAAFVKKLIESCPQIKIIVTSQEPLSGNQTNIAVWEKRREVPLLSFPDEFDPQQALSSVEYSAVKLFI